MIGLLENFMHKKVRLNHFYRIKILQINEFLEGLISASICFLHF